MEKSDDSTKTDKLSPLGNLSNIFRDNVHKFSLTIYTYVSYFVRFNFFVCSSLLFEDGAQLSKMKESKVHFAVVAYITALFSSQKWRKIEGFSMFSVTFLTSFKL